MPLDFPTRDEIIDRERTDVKAILPDSNPYEPVSIINALLVAYGGRIREVYDQLLVIQRDTFAGTAEGDALIQIASIYGLSLNPATQATGFLTFTGVSTTAIPIATELQSQEGNTYNTLTSATISEIITNITSITRAGSVATATVATAHTFASGMELIIAGADQAEYNGTFVITVTSETTYTYTVTGTPVTPATGTITATYTGASVEVISTGVGQEQNLAGGSELSLTSTIAGVDNTAIAQFLGVDGGTDLETIESLRDRLLQRLQNPVTPFNESNIILQAKLVAGVTRVFVFQPDEINTQAIPTDVSTVATDYVKVTFPVEHKLLAGMKIVISGAVESDFNTTADGTRVLIVSTTEVVYFAPGASGTATGSITVDYSNVQLGQVRILFVRDNDDSIIPSALEVTTVKDKILEIKPANTSDFDVIVQAPVAVPIDFDFTGLSPDTSGLRTSIEANLQALFEDTDVGDSITELAYQTAIQNSFDVETGLGVSSFVLSTPSGQLNSDFDEILTLNDITYTI